MGEEGWESTQLGHREGQKLGPEAEGIALQKQAGNLGCNAAGFTVPVSLPGLKAMSDLGAWLRHLEVHGPVSCNGRVSGSRESSPAKVAWGAGWVWAPG